MVLWLVVRGSRFRGLVALRSVVRGLGSLEAGEWFLLDFGPVGERGFEGGLGDLELFACEFHTRCTDPCGADACLFLYPFDELDELWHGVHAEKRKEPAVERKASARDNPEEPALKIVQQVKSLA